MKNKSPLVYRVREENSEEVCPIPYSSTNCLGRACPLRALVSSSLRGSSSFSILWLCLVAHPHPACTHTVLLPPPIECVTGTLCANTEEFDTPLNVYTKGPQHTLSGCLLFFVSVLLFPLCRCIQMMNISPRHLKKTLQIPISLQMSKV